MKNCVRIGGAQDDVEDFHIAMGGEGKADTPAIRNAELRARLILEEAFEAVEGLLGVNSNMSIAIAYEYFNKRKGNTEPSLPTVVHECIDTIYVCLGTLVEMGVDAEPIWNAVQAANMAKAGGGKDAGGKFMKPPGWTPPDIEGELRKQGWKP